MTGWHQRGLTIVELLVGMALGLFVVSTALHLLVTRIHEHRTALLHGRLMQDLRVAADIVTRDLRRAGYWHDASASVPDGGTRSSNPHTALTPTSGPSETVTFSYSRNVREGHDIDGNEQFGFRLRRGAIEMLLGAGNWQALTDTGTLVVTSFSITPALREISLESVCAQACPADAADCQPPRQALRSLAVSISGHAAADPRVVRSLRTLVRLRNDAITGACST